MPQQRANRLLGRQKVTQLPELSSRQDQEESEDDSENLDAVGKDEDEDVLEKLVLGDEAGFLARLDHDEEELTDEVSEAELEAEAGLGEEETNLEDVDDAEV